MKRSIVLLLIGLILVSCKKKSTPAPISPPVKAILLSPLSNSACTTGIIVTDTTSDVQFSWNASGHPDTYELNITNLSDNKAIPSISVNGTSKTVRLHSNTPYSWYVVSKSAQTSTTAQSDTWKFYNAESGTVSFAPFPAELISPKFGEQVAASGGTVKLIWTGSSIDSTPLTYDIYFGTSPDPALYKSGAASPVNSGAVASGTTYYWKVVSKDQNKNTSLSQISKFTVK